MTSTFVAFLLVSFVLIITPGPDTAITIRNALAGGRIGGLMTALGVSVAQLVWTIATSLGVVALLIAIEPIFLALKYAGAAYLIYLGVQALRAAFRIARHQDDAIAAPHAATQISPIAAFRQGLISNLGNPKMALFFASLLPQFAPAHGATFVDFLALGCVFSAMTFAWLAFYAILIGKAGDMLRRPKIRASIEGVAGAMLIGLGLRLAAEQR